MLSWLAQLDGQLCELQMKLTKTNFKKNFNYIIDWENTDSVC